VRRSARGASGYLSKDASGREICEAIDALARGEAVLGRDIHTAAATEIRRREPRRAMLSEREHE
jgi:DNA-binding NarL/FixJ family response regulator